MSYSLRRITSRSRRGASHASEADLIARFAYDPAGAYPELLDRYSPDLVHMIRRHMRDADDVMEVYTTVCERLRANDYQSLRRFRSDGVLLPWLAVVAANACRDQFRKKRASSVPNSVLAQLDEREQLVFRYHFRERMCSDDIAEIISGKHGIPCTVVSVHEAIAWINDLLSTKKRWLLLCALNANRPALSIDDLGESGFQPAAPDEFVAMDEAAREREQLACLSAALKSLGPDDRLMVMLRFEQDMTASQIADVMRIESHKHVYTRLRTIMGRLRRNLNAVVE